MIQTKINVELGYQNNLEKFEEFEENENIIYLNDKGELESLAIKYKFVDKKTTDV